MGRGRKEITSPRDRIGEPVDLEKCPSCIEHIDCFSNIEGKCTALKECGGAECVFYKPTEVAIQENRRIYKELRKQGRGDLIREHAAVLSALGVFDDELDEARRAAGEFEAFREKDYEKAFSETMESQKTGG